MQKTSTKSRAIPLCDCGAAKLKSVVKDATGKIVRKSYTGNSSMVPTMIKPTDKDCCVFCSKYVTWSPGYKPYCRCPESHKALQGEEFKYFKRKKMNFNALKTEVVTEVKPTHTNNCRFCGDLVTWKEDD